MGRKTQVFEYHRGHGNIVDYAGFDLSVWFEGIIPECTTVRNRVGIFDVSHMGRVLVDGPDAASFLNRMTTNDVSVMGLPCLVTRSGYTGEDGFEIYVWDATVNNPSNALAIWDMILSEGKEYGIRPVGLGARDVLRLEAGMCLYGNDMDEKTS